MSVFIDNMHVDEVQINGGGTEAVITGNMENPGKRLIVLEGDAGYFPDFKDLRSTFTMQ